MTRIVVDTNVAVSGLLWAGQPGKLLIRATQGGCVILATGEMMDELADVLKREPFVERLQEAGISADEAIAFYHNLIHHCPIPPLADPMCADGSDRKFIDLAVSEHAHMLVSGDRHLLALKLAGATPIVTVKEALEVLAQMA
ncbi:putative toxin-antitoxin system toxin component, PIN family [bacterium]|nr:putative toxin-antitoxin system toxin component, PIN family [bacterium]